MQRQPIRPKKNNIYHVDLETGAVENHSMLPSQISHATDIKYLVAANSNYDDANRPDRNLLGKWFINVNHDEVDAVWEKIKKYVQQGQLSLSKVTPNKLSTGYTIGIYVPHKDCITAAVDTYKILADAGLTDQKNSLCFKSDNETIGDEDGQHLYSADQLPTRVITELNDKITQIPYKKATPNQSEDNLMYSLQRISRTLAGAIETEKKDLSLDARILSAALTNACDLIRITILLLAFKRAIIDLKNQLIPYQDNDDGLQFRMTDLDTNDSNKMNLIEKLIDLYSQFCTDLNNELLSNKPFNQIRRGNVVANINAATDIAVKLTAFNKQTTEVKNLSAAGTDYASALNSLEQTLYCDITEQLDDKVPTQNIAKSSAMKITANAATMLTTLSSDKTKHEKLTAISTFETKCKTTPAFSKFMKVIAVVICTAVGFVLGAAAGFFAGMFAGSWSGVGAALTAMAGLVHGSITGAALGMAAGTAISGIATSVGSGLISKHFLFKPKPPTPLEYETEKLIKDSKKFFNRN